MSITFPFFSVNCR